MDTTKEEPMMLDPKPNLNPMTIETNIDYWTSQLYQLDQQRTMILEQILYWSSQRQPESESLPNK